MQRMGHFHYTLEEVDRYEGGYFTGTYSKLRFDCSWLDDSHRIDEIAVIGWRDGKDVEVRSVGMFDPEFREIVAHLPESDKKRIETRAREYWAGERQDFEVASFAA